MSTEARAPSTTACVFSCLAALGGVWHVEGGPRREPAPLSALATRYMPVAEPSAAVSAPPIPEVPVQPPAVQVASPEPERRAAHRPRHRSRARRGVERLGNVS